MAHTENYDCLVRAVETLIAGDVDTSPYGVFVQKISEVWRTIPNRKSEKAKRQLNAGIWGVGRDVGLYQPIGLYEILLHLASYRFLDFFGLPDWIIDFEVVPPRGTADKNTESPMVDAFADCDNVMKRAILVARAAPTRNLTAVQVRVKLFAILAVEPIPFDDLLAYSDAFSRDCILFEGRHRMRLKIRINSRKGNNHYYSIPLSELASESIAELDRLGLLVDLTDDIANARGKPYLSAVCKKLGLKKIAGLSRFAAEGRVAWLKYFLSPIFGSTFDVNEGYVPWDEASRSAFLDGEIFLDKTPDSDDVLVPIVKDPSRIDVLRCNYREYLRNNKKLADLDAAIREALAPYGGERRQSERTKRARQAAESVASLLADYDYSADGTVDHWYVLWAMFLVAKMMEGHIVAPVNTWERLVGVVPMSLAGACPEDVTDEQLTRLCQDVLLHYRSDETGPICQFFDHLRYSEVIEHPLKVRTLTSPGQHRVRRLFCRVIGPAELHMCWHVALDLADYDMHWRLVLALCGLRAGEIASIRRCDFGNLGQRVEDWTLLVRGTKSSSGRRLIVPSWILSTVLLGWLQSRRDWLLQEGAEHEYIISADARNCTESRAQKEWKNEKERIVGAPLRKFLKKTLRRNLTAHDLRRTALCSLGVRLCELAYGGTIQKIEPLYAGYISAAPGNALRAVVPGIRDAEIRDFLRRTPNADTELTALWRLQCVKLAMVVPAGVAGHATVDTVSRDYFPAWGEVLALVASSYRRYTPGFAYWLSGTRASRKKKPSYLLSHK